MFDEYVLIRSFIQLLWTNKCTNYGIYVPKIRSVWQIGDVYSNVKYIHCLHEDIVNCTVIIWKLRSL